MEKVLTNESIITAYRNAKAQGVDNPLGLKLWKVGKTREIYDLDSMLLIVGSDKISAFDVVSKTRIEGKGRALNGLSCMWFGRTESIFPNHYISMPDENMMLVRRAERIDIEWVARDYLYGSMFRSYQKGQREFWGHKLPDGMQLAEKLPETFLTPTTKEEHGHDIDITKEEAISRKLVTTEEWNQLHEATFRLYGFYRDVAHQRGLIIPDFKVEYGRFNGDLIQIDEAPNHDSARIWNEGKYEIGRRQEACCLDKEFYRQILIDSGIDSKNPPSPLPEIPEPVVKQIQLRVIGAYEVLARGKSVDELGLKSLEEVEQELGMVKRI
jgi:phosphoribosylaminoimidazole-succinocarboxamide synthase